MEPRCIVEIRWGRLSGTKAVIPPGGALRVGRTERADLVVPHDAQLSGLHFQLAWDGRRCAIQDLGSVSGTRLHGAAVTEAEVGHGDWIQAGDTDFMVYVEGRTPPRVEDPAEVPGRLRFREQKRSTSAAQALAVLRAEALVTPLYAVLDAARGERILQILRESVEPHRSLYEGAPGDPLEDVAPYLVGPLAPESRLLQCLVEEGWGKRWGLFCTTRRDFAELRRHLRRFLVVEIDDSGERLYFRFYDPRVMRRFLPTCSPRQEEELFGDILAFFVEGERGETCRLTPRPSQSRE
ncbi:DUF4123 domain-containing protein [Chondromyces apiculatus]|uniref:FHA domain-containing protein n=1 Tax=Chondromyces apiculatus DSM 436 TaxID=1192034 RepID=A0A017TGR9_9BACT|nr:DUF4123 domain-containing protein [Chondromyces apiculatus]EYF08092.1 Hypothetical protein CAP_5852 [Chondromyces apiculatus DSM 436]